MKMTATEIIERQERLKTERGVLNNHLQELADYVLPRKNNFTRNNVAGEKKGIELYDATGMVSCDILASTLHGLLSNPNSMWFLLNTANSELNESDIVIQYMQDLTKRIHGVFNNSNFQTEVHEYYLDLCAFGTATMVVEEDEKNLVRFSTKHLGEIYVEENCYGFIESVYRLFSWDARQIVEHFCYGMDTANEKKLEGRVGKKVASAFYKGDGKKFEIIHAVYKEEVTEKSAMPFVSQYILKADKIELEKEGQKGEGRFKRFPYLVSRWTKVSGEVYGRSPAMNALPEAKTLNLMSKILLQASQKNVDPPMQIPDDGFVRPLKTFAGGVNYYRAGSGTDIAKPLFNVARLDYGFEMIRDRQMKVKEAFYIDRLGMPQNDRMTTVEVNQHIQEQLRFMGPMLGRQQTEFLQPLIDRVVDIMVARDGGSGKYLGDVPPEISNVSLEVMYTSPIARAQRVGEADALTQALAASAPMMNIDPTAKDVVDTENVVREYFKIYGAPQKSLRTRPAIAAIRDARQKAQEAALQQQQEMHGAEVANKTAPLLKS
jgi:hypothetical protein